jgi:hypothetical protein
LYTLSITTEEGLRHEMLNKPQDCNQRTFHMVSNLP